MAIEQRERLALSAIRLDGGTQLRVTMNEEHISDLSYAILDGAELAPIVVFYDGSQYWLADGFHRYYATERAGGDLIAVEVKLGTRRDALLYAAGANATHGLRRTNADKRRSVETLLRDEEWAKWSNVAIAKRCGVDEGTVRNVRSFLSSEFPMIETPRLVERNGTTYTMSTSNIGLFQRSDPPSHPTLLIEEDEDEAPERTEEDRYQLAVDTGTLDYYYDDLRREAFERDRERMAVKNAALTALQSSESNEWYTPASYVDAARELMGEIDLDPASCEEANQVIKATQFYSKREDGLHLSWYGRVWLNPPYGFDGGFSNQERWTRSLIERYQAGLIDEAVLLVNANTEAKWFQPLYDYLICFTNHRIRFYNSEGDSSQPTQGNALVYFGKQRRRFIELFRQFGRVIQEANPDEC